MLLIKVECLDVSKTASDCADSKEIDFILDYGTRIPLGKITRTVANPPIPFRSQYHKYFDLPSQVSHQFNNTFI